MCGVVVLWLGVGVGCEFGWVGVYGCVGDVVVLFWVIVGSCCDYDFVLFVDCGVVGVDVVFLGVVLIC